MTSTMDIDSSHPFDWAQDTYLALNDSDYPTTQEKWAAGLSQPPHSLTPSAFSFSPALLQEATVERYGQITPPEDLSPAEPRRDSATRETSIPVDQLRREVSWPGPHNSLQALVDYQPAQEQDSNQTDNHPEEIRSHLSSPPANAAKRRRTSKQATTNHAHTTPASHQTSSTTTTTTVADDLDNPQPPKRKRGRPKSQPQMVEAFTAEGYPIQVSSARQSHLEKNRVAAHKCRQRKKEYINGLEGRAREYSSRNKALKDNVAMLREEVLTLKNEVLRHAGCGFWAVDEYLARCAGDLLGMERPRMTPQASALSMSTKSPTCTTMDPTNTHRASSTDSSIDSLSPSMDDFAGFDLLEDIDEVDD